MRNEEQSGRCLDSVRGLADEIVVVDTGSTDGTPEVAAGRGARVVDFPWCDDFAAARNESLATGDFIEIRLPSPDHSQGSNCRSSNSANGYGGEFISAVSNRCLKP